MGGFFPKLDEKYGDGDRDTTGGDALVSSTVCNLEVVLEVSGRFFIPF